MKKTEKLIEKEIKRTDKMIKKMEARDEPGRAEQLVKEGYLSCLRFHRKNMELFLKLERLKGES